jgi:hypothetical protein
MYIKEDIYIIFLWKKILYYFFYCIKLKRCDFFKRNLAINKFPYLCFIFKIFFCFDEIFKLCCMEKYLIKICQDVIVT